MVVTAFAGRHDVHPRVVATAGERFDVISSQDAAGQMRAAIAASVPISPEQQVIVKCRGRMFPSLGVPALQRNDAVNGRAGNRPGPRIDPARKSELVCTQLAVNALCS